MLFAPIPLHSLIDITMKILNTRDPYTFEHSWRVACISETLAEIMGFDEDSLEIIHIAAHLHDIGKIGIPDSILNKTDRLSSDEYQIMKNHSQLGCDILKKIKIFENISEIVLSHHERWDGSGYPRGIKGEVTSPESQIIAVADSFDAITSCRTYRKARSYSQGFSEIERCRGTQFSPDVVDILLSHKEAIMEALDRANYEIEMNAHALVSAERM